jgi:hypothetical protein
MNSFKKFLSIDGWCPDILIKGQIVLFIHMGKLKIGRVGKGFNNPEDLEEWKRNPKKEHEAWYIESLDGSTKYYPYASDVCLIANEGPNVHELTSQIVEV